VALSGGGAIAEVSGLGVGSLGRPPNMSKGLEVFGQGNVGQVVIVMHQGGGEWAQATSGPSSQSRRVVGRGKGMGT